MPSQKWDGKLVEISGLADWQEVLKAAERYALAYDGDAPHPTTFIKWRHKAPEKIRGTSKQFIVALAKHLATASGGGEEKSELIVELIDMVGASRGTQFASSSRNDLQNLVIRSDTTKYAISRLSAEGSLVGTYRTTRYKFGPSEPEKPLAVELLKIENVAGDLVFRHYFRRQDGQLAHFIGNVRVFGNMLVLQGTYEHEADVGFRHRFRAQKLKDEGEANSFYSRIRWGMMTSDVPGVGGGDPGACRVLYEKLPTFQDSDLEKAVFFASNKYLEDTYGGKLTGESESLADWVSLLISNNISEAPSQKGLGSAQERTLQLSQVTINKVTQKLVRRMDRQAAEKRTKLL